MCVCVCVYVPLAKVMVTASEFENQRWMLHLFFQNSLSCIFSPFSSLCDGLLGQLRAQWLLFIFSRLISQGARLWGRDDSFSYFYDHCVNLEDRKKCPFLLQSVLLNFRDPGFPPHSRSAFFLAGLYLPDLCPVALWTLPTPSSTQPPCVRQHAFWSAQQASAR